MIEIKERKNNGLRVVDLFCGAGIGAAGLKMCGYDIVWAIDNNRHAVQTYNENIGSHATCGDIKKLDINEVPEHDLLVATPVCKSFSIAGNGLGDKDTLYGDLTYYFINILKIKKPKAFLFENVSGMCLAKNKNFLDAILNEFNDAGYNVNINLVNCSDYGIPQDRKRLFIVGIRSDIENTFNFPSKCEKSTIRDAIYDIRDRMDIDNNSDVLEEGYSPRYLSRNRQRQWNEQAFTVVSEVRHLALYPEPPNYDIRYEDIEVNKPPRRFTVRECLRLQTAPDWFVFKNDIPIKKQYERCSGIPSLLAYNIGIEIEKTLQNKGL